MYSQHHRFLIHNLNQHPYKHSLDEFTYTNPALPASEVTNLKQTIDWLVAVLYPQVQDAVNTPGDLPAVGNTLGDYRVVIDDGDGKAAAYRWQQLEGDVTPQWYKIYDMDWGEQTVLSNFLLKTQDIYVYRYGIDDLDETGTPYAGDLSGQRIYGGSSANTHLTLYANSGDGVGPGTGFVQFGDNARPLSDSSFSLGTDTYRWLNFYADETNVGTLRTYVGAGPARTIIEDTTTNEIDFGATNLGTTGTVAVGTLLLAGGSITDSSGLIDFDDENLTTTGYIDSPDIRSGQTRISNLLISTELGSNTDLTIAPDSGLTNVTGNLFATGDISGAIGYLQDQLNINSQDDTKTFRLEVNNSGTTFFRTLNTGGFSFIDNGTPVLGLTNTQCDHYIVTNFRGTVTSWYNGATESLRISYSGGTRLDSLTSNLTIDGGATLRLEGGTNIQVAQRMFPVTDNTYDLGLNTTDHGLQLRWRTLSLSDAISDGTNEILMSTLLSLRDILVGINDQDSIFWDAGQSKFVASNPDTEIDHGTISGLADDDHLQYALLLGRAGGQHLIGGTAASDSLILESTSNATKGIIDVRSDLVPGTDNTYDLGASGATWADLHMSGQAFGLRVENLTSGTLPAAGNTGRLAWTTDTDALYVDNGTAWKKIVSDKYVVDDAVTWDGTNTSQSYVVSSQFDDAREALWDFLDNTNGFRSVDGANITRTATTVTVSFTIPPAAGTYRLVGVG